MLKEKLLKLLNYYYFLKNYYIYHILFVYTFFLRITYTYAEITISHFFTFLLSKYENIDTSENDGNFFYYFTHFFNFNSKSDDKFLNTKLFVVVYLPICLKCFYTLFFDYISYYIYMYYYFDKINNDFKKVYYSSIPYEPNKVNQNECRYIDHDKNGKGNKRESKKLKNNLVGPKKKIRAYIISKRKKISQNDFLAKLNDIPFEKYKTYLLKKKMNYILGEKRKSVLTIGRHNTNEIMKPLGGSEYGNNQKSCMKIKIEKCDDNHMNNILADSSNTLRVAKKNVFYNLKKKKNQKIHNNSNSNNLLQNSKFKKKHKISILEKVYMKMKNYYNPEPNGGEYVSLTNEDDKDCISMHKNNSDNKTEYSDNSFAPKYKNYIYKENVRNDRGKNNLVNFRLDKKKEMSKNHDYYIKLEDIKKDSDIKYNMNENLNISDTHYSTLNSQCNNKNNFEAYRFENSNNIVVCPVQNENITNGDNLKSSIYYNEYFMEKINNNVKVNFDEYEDDEKLDEKRRKSNKSLKGSLKVDYLFKDSNELTENDLKAIEHNNDYEYYYYYNKFKSFRYGIEDNNPSIREIINNKINEDYYHLKLNILILSCIIIQIFNSFILILISSNFIRKKEYIYFLCFLYSLLESVTDVISDNIFFLCGKFTNIYRTEFSLNTIYVIQVISKMILSISTIFIYFVYHIFFILYEHVNIMIINTFIKALSIFILSFIFLKNKDKILKHSQNEYILNANFDEKNDELDSSKPKSVNSFSTKLNVSSKNSEENGVLKKERQNSHTILRKSSEENETTKKNVYIFDQAYKNNWESYYHNGTQNYRSPNFKNNIFKGEELNIDDLLTHTTYNENDEESVHAFSTFYKLKKWVVNNVNYFKCECCKLKDVITGEQNVYDMNSKDDYTLLTIMPSKYEEEIYHKKYNRDYKTNNNKRTSIVENIKNAFKNNAFICYPSFKNSFIEKYNSLIEKDMKIMEQEKKNIKNRNGDNMLNKLYSDDTILSENDNNYLYTKQDKIQIKKHKKKKKIFTYPIKLLLNNLNFSNIFYICLLLIIPTFERIFLNYKIKNIHLDMHSYCYLNFAGYVTDLVGLYIYISYFNEDSYTSSIFISSVINILLLSLRFILFQNKFNQLWLLFLEIILKSLHKTFFYIPIYILVTKAYIKSIYNLMCSFYSSMLDASSFVSYYFEYLILSYYNIEESKDVFTLVYIIFLVLHLLSMVIISKLKKA
ncbi:conserved Plasmodium protein, unknown function [Plasmodium chabaudi chabaudi]|uniref:Uncharacterized protein n=1 Tax=Plasmodium chabaudi chabaudi TaxID=31271 RepID=A0A4V0KAK7_PLACU|nr:conserved Plasmodium protein, unknown function [Plasmodium chabaudi chabaudi]VTZ69922.1 conserved Plasmodium protein, unknown function [Plasmodium chabaudi chabaudi]|eukprot:XP_741476.2 conserved Plasmodium protein, unknown function [Plasmodium chabaudi chabaudi]